MPNLFRATMGGGSDIEPYIVIVTLNEDFAGQTVTLEQSGQDTLTKVCPTSAPYTVTFKPLHDGVWIAKSTTIDEMESVASTEPLLEWGTYYVELKSGFNFEEWLTQGRVTETFESLDDVLADEKTIRQLMTVHDSVDFLANNVTDEDAEKIFSNDLCAKWINLRDYALDTLYANDICQAAMDDADKYFYGEWALMPQVPKMTSATAPYGEVSASSILNSSHYAFNAFNDNAEYGWLPSETSTFGNDTYICYKFPKAVKIEALKGILLAAPSWEESSYQGTYSHIDLYGSNDNSIWEKINDEQLELEEAKLSAQWSFHNLNNDKEFIYYKATYVGGESAAGDFDSPVRARGLKLQFYAWQPKGNVPIMTSNTAPYGEVSGIGRYDATYDYYKAFNGNISDGWTSDSKKSGYIQYKFTNPTCVRKIKYYRTLSGATKYQKNIVLKASNDGVNFDVELYSNTSDYTESEFVTDSFANDNYYLYYRVYCESDSFACGMNYLQFYGRELSVSVPKMTSDTVPYGEVSASSEMNTDFSAAWHAFDDVVSATEQYFWNSTSTKNKNNAEWIQYKFKKPICIKRMRMRCFSPSDLASALDTPIELKISNDGINWTTILASTFNKEDKDNYVEYEINNNENCLYARLEFLEHNKVWETDYYTTVSWLQFYGLDYSERDFDEESPSKYIYDHGLNIVDNNYDGVRDNTSKTAVPCSNTPNSIYIPSLKVTNGTTGVFPEDKIDLTDYSLYVGKMSLKPTIQTVDVSNINISCFPYVFGWWDNASSYGTSLMVTSDINKSTKMIAGTIGSNIITHSGVGMADAPYEYYELYLEQ